MADATVVKPIHIKLKSLELETSYPVGVNLRRNMRHVKFMANAFKKINYFKHKEINILCTGSSGAIMAALFSTMVPNHCDIIYVHKKSERSHYNNRGTSIHGCTIIIDDFIVSGETIENILNAVIITTLDCILVSGKETFYDHKLKPKYFIHG